MTDVIFDHERINDLSEGDVDFEKQLFQVFSDNLKQDIDALQKSYDQDNPDLWRSWVHKIHGACGYIGAVAMEKVCEQRKQMADSKEMMRTLHDPIMKEYQKILGYLQEQDLD